MACIGPLEKFHCLWEILEWHDSLDSSLQCLNDGVSSVNGSFGVPSEIRVPSVIHSKHSFHDDVSLTSRASSSKKTKTQNIEMLSPGIRKHGESMIEVAQIVVSQARKNLHWLGLTLFNTKRNIVIRSASEEDEREKTTRQEVKAIKEDIKGLVDKLKTSDGTPRKSNCSLY